MSKKSPLNSEDRSKEISAGFKEPSFEAVERVKTLPRSLMNAAMMTKMVFRLIVLRIQATYALSQANYEDFVIWERKIAADEIKELFVDHLGDEASAAMKAYDDNLPDLIDAWMDQKSGVLNKILADYDFTEIDKSAPEILESWKTGQKSAA